MGNDGSLRFPYSIPAGRINIVYQDKACTIPSTVSPILHLLFPSFCCVIPHYGSFNVLPLTLLPITRQQNFRLVQNENDCKRHFIVHLKWKISTI